MILHSLDAVADRPVDSGSRLATDVRLDEAIALRRCAMYRKAFRGTAIGYPARAMQLDTMAGWMRRERVTVDVSSADGT